MLAIKSKASKIISVLICIFLVLAVCAVATISIPAIYSNASKNRNSEEIPVTAYEVNNEIIQSGFVLYHRLMAQQTAEIIKPIDTFFPNLQESFSEDNFSQEESKVFYETLSNALDNIYFSWAGNFDHTIGSADVIILDNQGNLVYGENSSLTTVANSTFDETLLENYELLTKLEMDNNGILTPSLTHGVDEDQLEKFLFSTKSSQYLSQLLGGQEDVSSDYFAEAMKYFSPPKNFTMILGIPNGGTLNGNYGEQTYVIAAVEPILFPILLTVLVFLIIMVLFLKYGARVQFRLAEKLHLETMGLLLIAVVLALIVLLVLATSMCVQQFIILDWGINLVGFQAVVVSGIAFFILLLLTCFLTICIFYSLLQIRELGIPKFFRKRSYIIKLFASFFHWLGSFSLGKSARRNIIKLLLINFVLVSIMCSFGANGIFFAAAYSVLLYFWTSRKISAATKSYEELISVTSGMVSGNFEVNYSQDLGMFSSLGEEIGQIRDGFKSAIEAETKSQKMKTELITNVSHDLKTPLTSIITYVDLLKNSSVSPDDQKKYINTIEQKANRLKILIEDLFEMSKVNSGNIVPQLGSVDLVRLLKQLEIELADESEKNNIKFYIRHTIDEAKVMLDSEMTYRVFDNLMINAVKYSLPNTRAYVDIYEQDSEILVEIKNTSAAPLDFCLDDLTERFVRGDESRNTDGSGLGLAIAKSFVDLQNGRFTVSADGDLFKVTVAFPVSQNVGEIVQAPEQEKLFPALVHLNPNLTGEDSGLGTDPDEKDGVLEEVSEAVDGDGVLL